MQIPITKKTKPEILEAYNQLLIQFDEANKLAKSVEDPKNKEILELAKSHSTENIIKDISDLKISIHSHLDSMADKLLNASRSFSQLQDAIAISQNQLQSVQNIEVAANALEQLVREYEVKKREFEAKHRQEDEDLTQTINSKKRDWQRETEDYNYTVQLKRRREKEQFEEEITKERRLFDERTTLLNAREEEIEKIKTEIREFNQRLTTEIADTKEKVTKELEHEFSVKLAIINKEKENDSNIAKLRVGHLEDINKRQALEIEKLRVETEKAYAQSQNMALKLIESSAMTKIQRSLNSDSDQADIRSVPK